MRPSSIYSLFIYLVKSVVVFLKSVAVVLKSILVVLNKGAPAVLHCVVVEPVLGRYEVGGVVRPTVIPFCRAPLGADSLTPWSPY